MWLTNPVSCWTYCMDTMSFKPVTQRLSRIPFISIHSEYMLTAAKITLLCSLTFWPAFIKFIQHFLIQSTLWLRMQTSPRRVIYLGFFNICSPNDIVYESWRSHVNNEERIWFELNVLAESYSLRLNNDRTFWRDASWSAPMWYCPHFGG